MSRQQNPRERKFQGRPQKKLTKCQVFLRGRRIEGIFARGSRLAKLLTNGTKGEIYPKRNKIKKARNFCGQLNFDNFNIIFNYDSFASSFLLIIS